MHLLKKQKALLALYIVAGHSRDNQFDILFLVLKDYSIVRMLRAIIANNASLNNTLCKVVEDYMLNKEDITWNAEQWWICCGVTLTH